MANFVCDYQTPSGRCPQTAPNDASYCRTHEIDRWGLWGEHPDVPVADWQNEVANSDTRASYWDFVMAKLEDM